MHTYSEEFLQQLQAGDIIVRSDDNEFSFTSARYTGTTYDNERGPYYVDIYIGYNRYIYLKTIDNARIYRKIENVLESDIQAIACFQEERNGVKWYSRQVRHNCIHYMILDNRIIQGSWVLGRGVFYALADLDGEERENYIKKLTA